MRATTPCRSQGFVERFPDLERVADPQALLDDPEVQLIVSAGIPGERADIAIAAMRHGKDVMVDKPGVITAGAARRGPGHAARDGPDLVDRFLRALRGAGGDPRGRAGPVRRDRPRRADRGLRAASPEPPHAARLVLPARAYRRHPDRHRLAPDRPVPVLHGLERCRDRRQRGRQLRQPGDAGVRGFRRDPAAQRAGPAATSGSTGTRPMALPPGATGAS